MLAFVEMVLRFLELLGGQGAVTNAAAALAAHEDAMASVDSVVARLRRRVDAQQPAA